MRDGLATSHSPSRLAMACALLVLTARADAVPSLNEHQTAPVVADMRRATYVVGDVIERHVTVTAPAGAVLRATGLPRIGRQSVWLTLLSATVRDRGGEPRRYDIDLRYQLTNAPTEVRSLALPAVHVRFAPDGARPSKARLDAVTDEQSVRIAPILPAHLALSAALIRPDRAPQPLSSVPGLLGVGLSLVLAGLIGAALLGEPLVRRYNGPFSRAYRQVRRAAAQAEHVPAERERGYQQALRALHRAFDQTAGRVVFHDGLGAFLDQHGRFADLRDGAERFLRMSRREFFECPTASGGDEAEVSHKLRWLVELARECRLRERRTA